MKHRIRWENKNFDDMGTLSYIYVLVINIHTYTNKVIAVEEKPGRRGETVLLQELTVPCNKERTLKI